MLAGGGRTLEDLRILRHDEGYVSFLACMKCRAATPRVTPSQMGRFERRWKDLSALADLFDQWIERPMVVVCREVSGSICRA
jgi:hypothetical protein